MSFQVHGKDLLGRIGTLTTKSGSFQTPHMFPVIDPNLPVLDSKFYHEEGIRAIMTNAYLLRRGRPGQPPRDVHVTLGFRETVATDSGAYQILEYGHVGVKPAEIVAYQEKIDTDIGVILDFPTGFHSDAKRAGWTVDETVRRADEALKRIKRKDILWVGPVQGGIHIKEVARSAMEMAKRPFSIYALGSPTELMEAQRFDVLVDMIVAAKKSLPHSRPLHLFGAGHPAMFPFIVALGCDLFDSAAYALYARRGRYLTSDGTQELAEIEEFSCMCKICDSTTPEEMRRLEASEREQLLSKHNLLTCFSELRKIREAIRRGLLWDLIEHRAYANPAFKKFLAKIVQHSHLLERFTPTVKPRGISHLGEVSDHRPEIFRYSVRRSSIPVERRNAVVLLPGRWRRPYHEDPRNLPIVSKLANKVKVSVCFYTIPFGPVPMELDETFPLAQTESFDSHDPMMYKRRAEMVNAWIKRMSPKQLFLVSEGEYGVAVGKELSGATHRLKIIRIQAKGAKPDRTVDSIIRRLN
ncbi:MAG TPA: tRNA guanosine(15) transglycosylase TgtA [Candidatus Bathyarchaeia archaeon]|nr:tRNA guanosine(15) transglycosylase TgtA [Candidatus Bathyarchaeia archaeon]